MHFNGIKANHLVFRHIGGTPRTITSRSCSESNSTNRKETTIFKKKSVLRLKVEVHIDDDGKCVSTLSDKNDDVEQPNSNIESSIDFKRRHSGQLSYVFSKGEKHKGSYENVLGFLIADIFWPC